MIFDGLIEKSCRQLSSGAFLVTGEEANPMTIGWAQWGIVWGKPVLTVLVRHSRYSHKLIESGCFTVSVPKEGTMEEELRVCGIKSGRDIDKRAELGLKLTEPKTNGVPGIQGCEMHFECKVLLQTEVSMQDLEPSLKKRFYATTSAAPEGDPHTLYFGEVIAAYKEE